ncbi:MAG TPA: thioredoxin family protein [Flavobacteriales bacterium]|nr:thioredoxin family protein [Flavobacteriales bacterium]
MKATLFIAIACFTGLAFIDNTEIKTIEIGTKCPMPDVKMKGIDNTMKSLSEFKAGNGLLVVFSCNTCPFVIGNGSDSEGWDGRYNAVYDKATAAKVGMVLVNSNHGKRGAGDGLEDMQARAKEKGFKMPYVLDEESALANAFGAKTTPHVFLFDKNMKLVYRGAIDDNVKSSAGVKDNYLETALESLSKGKKIKNNDTKPVGCSIKRAVK